MKRSMCLFKDYHFRLKVENLLQHQYGVNSMTIALFSAGNQQTTPSLTVATLEEMRRESLG